MYATKRLFQLMEDHQVLPSTMSFASALRACEITCQKESAFAFLGAFEERAKSGQLITDPTEEGTRTELLSKRYPAKLISDKTGAVFVYTAAMRCCLKAGSWRSALDVMGRIRLLGVPRDEHCFSAALEAWRQGREPDSAELELQRMHDELGCASKYWEGHGQETGRHTLRNSRIELYGKGLSMQNNKWSFFQASNRTFFDKCPSSWTRPGPNAVAYSIAMGCCVRAGQWKRALMLFESHMQRTVAVFPAVEGAIPKPSAPLEPEPDSIMAPRVKAENQTPTTPTASTLAWEDLNGSRTAAGTIGWDAVAWEAGLTTKTCRKRWAALNEAELSAARLLGYNDANWDAELEGDVTDTTDSDGGFALLEARAAPMKAAAILERVGNDWPTVADVLGEADVGGSNTFEIDLGAGSDTIMPSTPPSRAQSSNIVDARNLYAIYAATALIRDNEESYCLAAALAACKLGRQWERALAMLSAIPIRSAVRTNPYLWEHGILAASAARNHVVVLELFDMASGACNLTDKTLACAIRAYGWLHEPSAAATLHERHASRANGVTVAALFFALQLNGEHVRLLECYDRYRDAGTAGKEPACVEFALEAVARLVRQTRSSSKEAKVALPPAASRAASTVVVIATELKLKTPDEISDASPQYQQTDLE